MTLKWLSQVESKFSKLLFDLSRFDKEENVKSFVKEHESVYEQTTLKHRRTELKIILPRKQISVADNKKVLNE